MSSGGDLDGEFLSSGILNRCCMDIMAGDKFLVCWDKDLVPPERAEVRDIVG